MLNQRGVPLAYPTDFDRELLAYYREQYIAKRKLKDRYSIEDVLQLTKLGKKTAGGFEPNLGCALLFAADPRTIVPGAYIRVLRYEGVEEQFGQRQNILADEMIEGPLPVQIEKSCGVPSTRKFVNLLGLVVTVALRRPPNSRATSGWRQL